MIYVATCCGCNHSQSEDSVLIGTEVLADTQTVLPFPPFGFVGVADGVGGNLGGAQASRFICGALAKAEGLRPDNLLDYLHKKNDSLIQLSKETPAYSNMATTLSGIYITDDGMYLFHVGNSRVFVKQGKYLKQVTSDHTTHNWLMRTGNTEAAQKCNKYEITNCFGGGDASLISKLSVTKFQDFSYLLLTTDGVHEYVDIDCLEEILNSEISGEEKCARILLLAQKAGSKDDKTIVLACRD